MRRLVIDTLTVSSPGGSQLQAELSAAVARNRPQGWEALLIAGTESRVQADLPILRLPRPQRGWVGMASWVHFELPARLMEQRAHALFAMSGLLSPRMRSICGLISTVNNMVPFTPQIMAELPALSATKLRNLLLGRQYLAAMRLADFVLLHSEHALRTMSPMVSQLEGKTRVVLTGVPSGMRLDEKSPPAHPQPGRRYFFYLSAMQRYKNHPKLIASYSAAAREHRGEFPELVIAGIPFDRPYVAEVQEAIVRSGGPGRITYLDSLPRESIPGWLHHAEACVFPSLCETNSVVQAEILGMQGVMACSNRPPMSEVAGDAALFFDAENEQSISFALRRLAAEPALRAELRRKSIARAAEFSWDRCGEAIWELAKRSHHSFERRKGQAIGVVTPD